MTTIRKDCILQLRGEALCDRDGDKIGSEVSEDVRREQVELIDRDGEPAEGIDGAHGSDEASTAERRPLPDRSHTFPQLHDSTHTRHDMEPS